MRAQKQYWGYSVADVNGPSMIFHVDSNGMDPEFVHAFGATGIPQNFTSPFLASNGLMYGTINGSGTSSIFSYDPVLDTFMIKANLGTTDYPRSGSNVTLMEGSSGVLYGSTQSAPTGSIFKYYIANDSLALAALIPNQPGQNGTPFYIGLRSPLFKASNNKLYGTRIDGQVGLPALSRVIRLDPVTDALDYTLYSYPTSDGYQLNGDFIEHDSRLYSTTATDGFHTIVDGQGNELPDGRGAIYSCSTGTLDHVRHVYFNDSIRNPEGGMIPHPNGLWYGLALNQAGFGNGYGLNVLYSYDVTTNTLSFINKFIPPTPLFTDYVWPGLLLASNGNFYGAISAGLFEYDLEQDTFRLCAPFQSGLGRGPNGSMIEICRKPNYKPRPTTGFDVCAGAYFFYDLKNVNATSVVWRRNGNVVPNQTDQLLEFDSIGEADEGVWTCTLTNECGVTEPPAITITVNAGTFTTSTISGDTLLCGTGDAVVLSGNNGGIWAGPVGSTPTGTATATASADLPGSYSVWNTQACGLSLSNSIEVVHLDSAVAPYQILPNIVPGEYSFCPSSPFVFANDPGPWGDLPTGIWQDGSTATSYTAADPGYVYVTSTNACNSDTSGIYHVVIYQGPPIPPVIYTDNFGPADRYLCTDDSVTLGVAGNDGFDLWDANGQFLGSLRGGLFTQSYTIDSAGVYYLTNYGCTGPTDTLIITIHSDTLPPEAATIIPTDNTLTGCDQDTVYLSSDATNAYWTWVDGNGQTQVDSSSSVQVDWGTSQYNMTPFNGCGDGPQSTVFIQGTPAPDVQFSTAWDTLCYSDGSITLSEGTPSGGTYSGPGISGTTFDPAAAGIGEHTITYSFSDGNCTGYAQDVVVVDACMGLALVRSDGTRGVRLSPNPNNGNFTLFVDRNFTRGIVDLYTAQAKRMGTLTRLVPGTNEIHAEQLTPGVYQLLIEIDGNVIQRSVMIIP